MDCSLPGSSVHGIFQTRALEWGATAFSVLVYNRSLINVSRINTAVVEDTPDMDMLLLPMTFLKYISYCVSFCKKEKKKEKPLGVCFFLSK